MEFEIVEKEATAVAAALSRADAQAKKRLPLRLDRYLNPFFGSTPPRADSVFLLAVCDWDKLGGCVYVRSRDRFLQRPESMGTGSVARCR